MDTLLCNDDGAIVIGTYDPSNTLLRLSADQYTAGSATWADQSGNGLDFTVSTNTSLKGTDADGFPYMNFSGSYGYAQRLVGGVLTNIPTPTTGKYTIFCVTQLRNTTSGYRTLTHGATQDNQIVIQTGTNNLGLYDGGGVGFRDSGFDVTTDMKSTRNLLVWELSTTVPIYKFQLNESGTDSIITNVIAGHTLPFASIGMWNHSPTEYWGNIYEFIVYDGVLSASERDYVAEYLAYKWAITEKLPSFTSTQGVTTLESIGALDDLGVSLYNTVGGAYALRRLFGLYPGPQVRLRRSTDNAETNVYFSSDGFTQNLNLTTWLGGATGYIVTWYDQGPNATHTTAYGTSATTFPSIYEREDGLYAVYFPGSSTTVGGYFNAGSVTFNVATNGGVSTFSRVNLLGANLWEKVYDYGNGSANNNLYFARNNTSTSSTLSLRQGSTNKGINVTNGVVNNTWQSFGNRIQGSGSSWVFTTRKDGTETSGTQTVTYSDRTITNSYIGRSNWSVDEYSNMYLSCQIFFNTGSITSQQFTVMENALY